MAVTSSPGAAARSSSGRQAGPHRATATPSVLDVDRITVVARYFGFPPAIRGFLDGDILQVLVYDRVLDEAERKEVEDYLTARTRAARARSPPATGEGRQAAGRRPEPAARADARAGLRGRGNCPSI